MGCCSGLGRVILVILNLVFVLIALALLAVGGILRFTPGTIMSFLAAGIDNLVPTGSNINLPSTLSFLPMFGDIGVALLIGGAVLFILSFLACCGACCRWRPFLIIFAIIMIVIIVVLAALCGLFLVKNSILHKNIREGLSETAVREYKDNKDGGFSSVMNLLNIKLQCCGITGSNSYGLSVPASCCQTLSSCVSTSTPPYWDDACYDKLFDYIENNKTWAIIAVVVFHLLLLLEVIFAIVIVKDVGDNKVRPV